MPCLPVTAYFKGWGMISTKPSLMGRSALLEGCFSLVFSLWHDKASVCAPGVSGLIEQQGQCLADLN